MANPLNQPRRKCAQSTTFLAAVFLSLLSSAAFSQSRDTLPSPLLLKALSLEELMNIEVTSVSKKSEKLREAPSAVQVITQQDIRHSGARTLAEALRLAPNLQVAQVNSSQWAISARGFNNVLANKLLVMIDGRTVYTPLYAGVFWDVQNVLLEDVERIEVISGPGGSLWGANAVNGVINIITKRSSDTKGLYAQAATGSNGQALGSIRYGGQLAKGLSYRVFGSGYKLGNAIDTNGLEANDKWWMINGGFRLDWEGSKKDKLTLQQNIYYGKPNPDAADTSAIIARGDNILAKWNHIISEKADYQLQAYYDHTWRDFRNGFTEDLKTYDIEWQNRYQIDRRHELTYGLDFRLMDHTVTNLELFAFLPAHKRLYLYSLFLQDEIMLIKERLRFTAGLKMEHNSYTGFEYQPDVRLTWTPTETQTVWTAVSRAVRTPARIDRDFYLFLTPDLPFVSGSDNFRSENVMSYQLGWRLRPRKNLSISLSSFYNVYDNIRSVEPGPAPFNIPITFSNGVEGKAYGMELAATYQLASWWNLRGGYTFVKKELSVKPGSKDMNEASAESDDPKHQFLLQSSMNISKHFEAGAVLRYSSKLPDPYVASYAGLDVRIGWNIGKSLQLNIVGQHLLKNRHVEFIASPPKFRQIQRSIYGSIAFRL
ncbi:MAG: TonB-dependent receptor [Flavitalea sp.]